jgi:hypothetical protein
VPYRGPIEFRLLWAVEEGIAVIGAEVGGTTVMLFIGPVSVLKPASRLDVRLESEPGPSEDNAARTEEATAYHVQIHISRHYSEKYPLDLRSLSKNGSAKPTCEDQYMSTLPGLKGHNMDGK